MIEPVEVDEPLGLEDYAEVVHLAHAVQQLRQEAASLVPRLAGRKVWMVNSTSRGGGVAEMLPKLVSMLNELGVETEWVVMGTQQPGFFDLTKRLHNLIHGQGDPGITDDERALYAAVSSENAADMKHRLRRGDILVIHDPQPLGMGALLRRELDVPLLFRCHIGLDDDTPETRAAWGFLSSWAEHADHAIFSAPEYIPPYLANRTSVIRPALDPLSFKNRELSAHKLSAVLVNAGLAFTQHPVVTHAYAERATRLRPDGRFAPIEPETCVGLLYRPIVSQISRWDRLKGFKPLLDAFVYLKRTLAIRRSEVSPRHQRRLAHLRLVLAGPDPAAVADDPEAQDVLAELTAAYQQLDAGLQDDVALLSLPMTSRQENALMVNAIQRCSSVVVQNSLREGFGLTVTEAMWKRCGVVGSQACGIRQQIRDRVDGRLVADSEDVEEIAHLLDDFLEDLPFRARLGRSAQRRVHDEFLVFTQAHRWLETLIQQT